MKERDQKINLFIEKIQAIQNQLSALENEAYELFELYNGNVFSEQEQLAVTVENWAIAATHETASQLAFYIHDLETITQFIAFREEYSEFTNDDLEAILGNTLSLEQKRKLSNRFENLEKMMLRIQQLIKRWNQIFNNKSYLKIKELTQNER